MKRLFFFILSIVPMMFVETVYSQSKTKFPITDKIVVLTFDDAVKSQYTVVAPLLKKYGFGATFFVCEFPGIFGDENNSLSWADIKQLSDWGFEIGNHTQHHVHVDDVSGEDLKSEIEYIDHKCQSLHIPKPINFAYPGYATDSSKIEILKRLGYLTARTGGSRVYLPGKDDPFYVPSFTPINDLNKALDAISQAKDGNIVILTIHGVPDNAHDWVSTSPKVFEAYMRFLKDNHYKVLSMRDLQNYLKKN